MIEKVIGLKEDMLKRDDVDKGEGKIKKEGMEG